MDDFCTPELAGSTASGGLVLRLKCFIQKCHVQQSFRLEAVLPSGIRFDSSLPCLGLVAIGVT